MPDDRYKTTLEIGVDDSDVRRLGSTIQRALEVEPILRFRRAIEEATAQITRLNAESQRAAGMPAVGPMVPGPRPGMPGAPPGMPPIPPPRPPAGGGGGAGAGRRPPPGGMRKWWRTATATGVGFLGAQAFQRAMGMGPGFMRGQGALASAFGGIPIAGPFLQAGLQAAENLSQRAIMERQIFAQTAGMAGIGQLSQQAIGRAARVGIARPQLAMQMGQLAQITGVRGEGIQQIAPALMQLERVTGIQAAGQAGRLIGAMGVAGRQAAPREALTLMTDVISAGIEAGMRKNRIGEFISQIASQVESLRRQGIMIEPRSMAAFAAGVGRLGGAFRGEAGQQAATTMMEVMRGAGERNDFFGAMVMQTAMEQGRDPFQAMEALEQNPQEILPQVLRRMGRMGGSVAARAMALRQGMQGRISFRQAREMVQAAEAGRLTAGRFRDIQGGAAAGFIAEEGAAVTQGMGVARAEAALQNKEIAAGMRVVGQMQQIRGFEIELAAQGAKFGAAAGEMVVNKFKEYSKTFAEEGIGGLIRNVMGDFVSGFEEMIKRVINELMPGAGQTPREALQELGGATVEELLGGIHEFLKDIASVIKGEGGTKFADLIVEGLKTAAFPGGPLGRVGYEVGKLILEAGEGE